MLTTCARLCSSRCIAALGLWAVVFVLLAAVGSPEASALIEPGRGAGADFEVLDSRTRHGVSVLVAVAGDSTDEMVSAPLAADRTWLPLHSDPAHSEASFVPQQAAAVSHSPPNGTW